ncbi:MAG TPA: hypothetical protein VFR85_05185 [Anaeromyxobacteraceae bacterium]|nr:hypothetical protein [Anaeromyxobacteraceae bacterium]
MRPYKSMLERLLESGAEAASRAARAVADIDTARGAAAAAVGLAQRGKKRFDEAQERVLHALGLAAREDYAEVARRMARLKRKVRELSRQLDGEGGRGRVGSTTRAGAAEVGETRDAAAAPPGGGSAIEPGDAAAAEPPGRESEEEGGEGGARR